MWPFFLTWAKYDHGEPFLWLACRILYSLVCFQGDWRNGSHWLVFGPQQDTMSIVTDLYNLVLGGKTEYEVSQKLKVGKIFRNKLQCWTARMINWCRLLKWWWWVDSLSFTASLVKARCVFQRNALASAEEWACSSNSWFCVLLTTINV